MRLFIATPLNSSAANEMALVLAELKKRIRARVKWSKPGNLHITYHFLGDIEGKTETIKEIMENLKISKFKASFSSLGVFPNFKKPEVIWAGISEGADKLKLIADNLYAGLTARGFVLRDDFIPHITLGRIKGKMRGSGTVFRKIAPLNFEFEILNCDLIKSELKPAGSEYTLVHRKELQ